MSVLKNIRRKKNSVLEFNTIKSNNIMPLFKILHGNISIYVIYDSFKLILYFSPLFLLIKP